MEMPLEPINWLPFQDQYSLPVQADGDGGDTANRHGLLVMGSHLTGEKISFKLPDGSIIQLSASDYFDKTIAKLEVKPGILVRHPDQWNDPEDFSRDQHSSIVMGAGVAGKREFVLRVLKQHLLRFGRYQNKDWASPEHWAIYIRALGWGWYAYPFLCFADLFTVGNSIFRVIASYNNADDTSNDVNHVMLLVLQQERTPTPISRLAKYVYTKFRKNAGMTNETRLEGLAAQTAYDHYFRKESGAPPMNELWAPIIHKYLSP